MANRGGHVKQILVVGGGLIGIRHLEAVKAHPECSLIGLADPDMSLEVDAPRFASMAEVTAAGDGVIIATPTHLHAAHGMEAAKPTHLANCYLPRASSLIAGLGWILNLMPKTF